MSFQTIPELFFQTVNTHPDRIGLADKINGEWVTLTYSEIKQKVEQLAAGLTDLGVKENDKVAILSNNNSKWAISDYAIVGLGAISVPVYPTLIPEQIKYIMNDSESSWIIAENVEQTQKVIDVIDDCPNLKGIVSMDGSLSNDPRVTAFEEILSSGDQHMETEGFTIRDTSKIVTPDHVLTLIYTSGTTGNPKGVILTHKNLASNVTAGRKAIDVGETDVFLSFLPLSHSFERMVGHYTAFSAGSAVYFAENIDKVAENMREVKPTVMASVPRLFEKMYTKVLDSVNESPAIRQKIFWWAIGVGTKASKYFQRNEKPTGFLATKFNIANKLVFSKLMERVGGRLRYFVSGGAPLTKDIGEFFSSANIPILEGYGLTETSPVITVNRMELYKFGTVGSTIDGVEVKIAEDGEILCRGDNVMVGYYNNEAATKEVLADDGWFHTGDIGELDEDNYLRITDRKKSLLVTSGGKNVAPAPLESALTKYKYIEQCLVIGDQRNFISAMVVPAFDALLEWAEANNISTSDTNDLVKQSKVQALYDGIVEEAMEPFARYEKVRKIAIMSQPWTIEGGELTPKLSVKRKVVLQKYADVVDGIYSAPKEDQ